MTHDSTSTDDVSSTDMKKKNLSRDLLLSMVSVFHTTEFTDNFSIAAFDCTKFYKWVFHKATTDAAKNMVNILTERVSHRVVTTAGNDAQSSEQTTSETEKTFLECELLQQTRQIIRSDFAVATFCVTDSRIWQYFHIAFNNLDISVRFLNGASHLQMILCPEQINLRKTLQ